MRRFLAGSLVCLAWPTAALASAPPGVTYDPGSPAGKEYALPLDRARAQADPHPTGAGSAGGVAAAPMFGVGIRPAKAAASRTGAKQGGGTGGLTAKGPGSEPSASKPSERVVALDRGSEASASSRVKTGGVFALGVVVLGLGAGLGARSRRRS